MKLVTLLLFPWMIATATATSLTLADSPVWQALSDEQTAPIRKNFALAMRDFSVNAESGASALFLELPAPKGSDGTLQHQRVNVVAGAKSSVIKNGYTATTEGETAFGPLPGAYVVFTSPDPEKRPHILMLMGFSRDKLYSATFYSKENPAELSASRPFVKSYFSRMAFSDVQLPEEGADPDSNAYKIGYMIGYILVPFLLLGVGGGFSYLIYRLFRKKPGIEPTT